MGIALPDRFIRVARAIVALLTCLSAMLLGTVAHAQAATTVVDTTDVNFDGANNCSNAVVRNFVVSPSNNFKVGDVDIGVFITHSARGFLAAALRSPAGTQVLILAPDTNILADNLNVRFDDEAGQAVNTDGNTTQHSAVNPPPFANQFRPASSLTAFDGENSVGTWQLLFCDSQSSNRTGVYRHGELYLTAAPLPANYADLSLTKTASTTSPAHNSNVTFTLRVTNSAASNQTATATILDRLPTGFVFVSASGNGSYNASTGIWTPSTIAPNQTREIQIVARMGVGPGGSLTNTAQVQTSNRVDPDSTPGNNNPNEDDQASVTITTAGSRIAGTPPVLVCPKDKVTFDWQGRNWPQGSTDNTYNLAGINTIRWQLQNPAVWLNIAQIGGQQPAITTGVQNGTPVLSKGIGFASKTQNAITTITLGGVVDGMQLRVIDVDFASEVFADRITVTGTRNGGTVTVLPTLTAGTANYVVGNSAFGDVEAPASSNAGDVWITFNQPVDTVILEYGSNVELAPDDPVTQAIQMAGSISICSINAQLAVTKSSVVIDDAVAGPSEEFHLPGATLRYCILITNPSNGTATEISASDTLPAGSTYVPGSMKSGAACNSATVVEDDDANDGDETDGLTANISGTIITAAIATLPGKAAKALTFNAKIN